ncbi:CGNR zinc finger domain-containing protein [Nonomuraea sp. CA-218870]|uniref:CGNR zinc finger domain-containing protein n=1 Tax=Nonomuraea sp. CA-218870 TaxID=3239998 RepID=UPI003D89C709
MDALTGEPLALDLINTRAHTPDGDVDFLETAEGLSAWLALQSARLPAIPGGPPGGEAVSDGWVAAVRSLREHVESAVTAVADGAPLPADAVAALNEAALRAPSSLSLGPSGVISRRAAPPLDRLLAELAESAITLLGGSEAAKIKSCEAPGCRMFFLPAHPRRRWCSPELCGNRVRVARHYRRARVGRPRRTAGDDREDGQL